jgi:diguanylate cyclase (GGDEF)-like protein
VRTRKGLKLRFVLGLLVIGSVLLTAVIGGYFALSANKASLTAGYLESNSQYAKKLASNTSELLQIMRNNIEAVASMASKQMISQKELDIWYAANEQYFNSILLVDADRTVRATSFNSKGIEIGMVLSSVASFQAVQQKRTLISEPYVGAMTHHLLVLISSPIFNEAGEYEGFAAGTIYLDDSNALNKLLSEHFYGNGSYVYVADKYGHLIFHPDKARLNESITTNEVINKAISGLSGAQKIINSQGGSYFAGYANEPMTGWAIVAQTPTSIVDKPLKKLIWDIVLKSFPIFIIILLVAWRVSYLISKPLFELAAFSEEAILSRGAAYSKMPKESSYIYEVRQLNQSINNHLALLNKEIRLDGLTGLANRKTFDLTIQEWLADDIPFALILLDIDHFKKINDQYGHLIGDEVLTGIASVMKAFSRSNDLCFRYGGEEFGILVKFGNVQTAVQMAERLREAVAAEASPTGNPIFVSIGISCKDGKDVSAKELIEMADIALYQSKADGRNRTTAYQANKTGQP